MKKLCIIFVLSFISLYYFTGVKAQDSLTIGFSLGDFFVDRWYKDRDYFVEFANQQGVKVLLAYGYGDAENQETENIRLIDEGVKVLAIVPTDAEAVKKTVEYAHKNGVKVISYDRLIKNAPIDYYISFDNEKVGQMQAECAIKNKPKGNYVLLGGPVKDNNALMFMKGQKDVLQPYIDKGDIKIIAEKHLSEWGSMEAYLEMQNLTDFYGNIAAVVASNDLIASGVIESLDLSGADKGTVITGQDASIEGCKNILSGKQTMTVYKSVKALAAAAVKLAVEVANQNEIDQVNGSINNGHSDVPSVLLPPVAVNKENLYKIVVADGFLTEDELK